MRAIQSCCLLIVTTLIVSACAGTPAFVRLADTHWQLTQISGQRLQLDAAVRTPYLLMDGDSQRLEGHTGCNRINGTYSGGDDELVFDSLASTRRYCPNAMDQERAFIDALERTATVHVDDKTLTLIDQNGRALAVFKARADR